ncbi:MAG: glycine cleavage T C-terminal barrel domain-containing protein [Rhodoglobus sp.]
MSSEPGPAATPTDPFTALPGAVGSPPEHYGNPLGEQQRLAAGEAIVDLSDRAVLTITGPDRLSWLDSVTSQSLTHLAPGDSAETLLLDPTGRVQYAIRLLDDGVTAWLLLEASEAPGLLAWLTKMRFMLRVDLADVTPAYATIGTFASPAALTPATSFSPALPFTPAAPNGVPLVWRDPWSAVQAGGHQYSPAADHPAAQWTYSEVLVARGELAAASALPVAGTIALEALRVAAWRPRLVTEADDRTIPHELDWLRSAVHLNKGCYRGQETVAKVHNLGHPPRRLVMLHLDGSEGVFAEHGSPVVLDGVEVGQVTSAALHYELGPIALAVIKRSVDPSVALTVQVGETLLSAAQEIIVPTDAGAEANVPRLPRLGAVTRG